MDIKLLPKEYKSGPVVSKGFKFPSFKLPQEKINWDYLKSKKNLWLVLAIILLVLSILGALGLLGYKNSLKREKVSLEAQLQKKESERDLEFEKQAAKMGKNIKDLQKIMETHIYPSRLFKLLEELTLTKVQWTHLTVDLVENKIIPKGRAESYSVLARQIAVFENDPRLKKVETSNIVLGPSGGVDFNMVLEFKPAILKYVQ